VDKKPKKYTPLAEQALLTLSEFPPFFFTSIFNFVLQCDLLKFDRRLIESFLLCIC